MARIPTPIDKDASYKAIMVRLPRKICRQLEREYRKRLRNEGRASYQEIIGDLISDHLQ